MEQAPIYSQNLFGLQSLDESGRVFKHRIEGVHLEFKDEHIQTIFVEALKRPVLTAPTM